MQLLSALLSVIDIRLKIPQLRTANLRSRANPRTNDASSRALQSKVSGSIGYQPVPFGDSPNGTTAANFLTQETKQEIGARTACPRETPCTKNSAKPAKPPRIGRAQRRHRFGFLQSDVRANSCFVLVPV